MLKKYRLVSILAAFMLLIAACTAGAGTAVDTPAVPETEANATNAGTGTDAGAGTATDAGTGIDAGAGTATDAGTAGDAAGTAVACAGVDTEQLMTTGQTYYTENCASCHGQQGEGQGDFPALAANTGLTADSVTDLVQDYLAVDAHPKDVSPDDLAAVLTYVRGSFGNTAGAICPTDIQLPAAP